MECAVCGTELIGKMKDVSFNKLTNKSYKRKIYVCTKCDIWITVETPLDA